MCPATCRSRASRLAIALVLGICHHPKKAKVRSLFFSHIGSEELRRWYVSQAGV